MNEGMPHADRSLSNPMYMTQADGSINMGGMVRSGDTMATMEQYENIFGPAARDIKLDNQRNKRHQRWHLPDVLHGPNNYLTDRVDGLITDATNSPFTRNILPYVYLENPDQKLKWNVYSFDEGIASRVPYESAARVLPQTKRSFSGYVVRHGLAISMEHNFMVSEAGRQNFKRQLMQLVGSIQLTNDHDVHVALLQAPSYQKTMDEKYHDTHRNFAQFCRSYSDQFGMLQKVQNGLDILIEDAKKNIRMWGGQEPTFMLCNGAITAQLTMLPEKTNYLTNGPDGKKRLAQGPDLPSYRGLSIINTRQFSTEEGTQPRDILRRRVRVGQYYWAPKLEKDNPDHYIKLYDQNADTMRKQTATTLHEKSKLGSLASKFEENKNFFSESAARSAARGLVLFMGGSEDASGNYMNNSGSTISNELLDIANAKDASAMQTAISAYTKGTSDDVELAKVKVADYLIIRPNIEHNMLGAIVGRGGTQELGCTFWGQTELSCYDDAQHGIWGMSYKYHERAMVMNEKNMVRMFDIAFDGYVGGMDCQALDYGNSDAVEQFRTSTYDRTVPYSDASMLVMAMPHQPDKELPNPMMVDWRDYATIAPALDPKKPNPDRGGGNPKDLQQHHLSFALGEDSPQAGIWRLYCSILKLEQMSHLIHACGPAGESAINNLSDINDVMYHGTMEIKNGGTDAHDVRGTGHLGHCWPGVASVREGRGISLTVEQRPTIQHIV